MAENENVFHGLTESGKTYEICWNDDSYSIEDLRLIIGETLVDFSNHVGIPLATLKSRLNGTTKLTWEDVCKICKYCNISTDKIEPKY